MSNPQNLRQYPSERYYYGWYGGQQQPAQASPQTDGQVRTGCGRTCIPRTTP